MTSFALSVLLLTPGAGGWGPSGCVAVAAPIFAPLAQIVQPINQLPAQKPAYEWRRFEDVFQLWNGNVMVGGYRPEHGKYYSLANGQWAEAQAPVAPPAGVHLVEQNYGLDLDKIHSKKTYQVNGNQVSREEALDALKLPDDARLPFLTVIGEGSADVRRDLESDPKLRDLASHYRVQFYEKPANPIVDEAGFVKTGKPTIYLQKASGEVLHRQDEYRGPEKLAEAMAEAVRKADPKYDSKKDPDLNKSIQVPEWVGQIPWWAWGLGAAVAVALFVKRKEPTGS